MHKELKWIPGTCAYCNGAGKVHPETEKNVPVDATYLSNNLPAYERKRLINGNPEALERTFVYEGKVNEAIDQICDLHF